MDIESFFENTYLINTGLSRPISSRPKGDVNSSDEGDDCNGPCGESPQQDDSGEGGKFRRQFTKNMYVGGRVGRG